MPVFVVVSRYRWKSTSILSLPPNLLQNKNPTEDVWRSNWLYSLTRNEAASHLQTGALRRCTKQETFVGGGGVRRSLARKRIISGQVTFSSGRAGVLPGKSPHQCWPRNSRLIGSKCHSWERLGKQVSPGLLSWGQVTPPWVCSSFLPPSFPSFNNCTR